jgi:type I restriction-modification system DNA methylase subunit
MNITENLLTTDIKVAQQNIIKLIKHISEDNGASLIDIFRDATEAIALGYLQIPYNFCGKPEDDTYHRREKTYMDIVGRYKPDSFKLFPIISAIVTHYYENKRCDGDLLGNIYEELVYAGDSNYKGQFFTPFHLAKMMSDLNITKDMSNSNKFKTVSDEACGSGITILGCGKRLLELGIDPSWTIKAICADLDATCVNMTYIQLYVNGIHGVVKHQNTLSGQVFDIKEITLYEL